jgi:hypothetical protein
MQDRAGTVPGMTTSLNPSVPPSRRPHGWRLALLASGVTMLAGGALHPDADAQDSLREELATMTADDRWVPGHTLLLIGTVLLVGGLWAARRAQVWPRVGRALPVAIAALAVYVVETVFHLAAAVDSHALHEGHAAPVAFTHIGLASVLYPLSGLAVVFLAATLVRVQSGVRRAVAVLGILGGLAHAASVPLTMLLPDTELTPVFAAAGILLALWALGTGATGAAARRGAAERELEPVAG